MTTSKHPQSGTNLLQTALAKPYHYRRSGRYYLRLRPQGTAKGFFTLSLRTTDKATAMTISQEILQTLKAFHFENPAATWDALRERLVDIAESCLTMAHGDGSLVAYEMIHDEQHVALREASAKLPLSVNQQKAVSKALEILEAAQERLEGRPGKLVEIVRDLKGEACSTPVASSPSLSVLLPQEPLTWDYLSNQYLTEHSVNIKDSTKASMLVNYKAIKGAFEETGLTDLRNHNRDHMVAIRTALLVGRQHSTVNNILTKMMTVMDWAVDNDYLTKAYTSNLKLTKGTDSKREGFTKDQVVALMNHSAKLPADSWERWGLSLLAITGARVGEIAYLTKQDIKQVDGLWCIHINENGPNKSIKNKHSDRTIPLIDGAFNTFELKEFLKAVEAGALPSDHGVNPVKASKNLGLLMKEILGETRETTQTLHSLRHFLSSALQAEGVPVAFAQAITGHSSRTITFGTYGSAIPVGKLAEELKKVLKA
ncbi:tyrosine-type recombinase/integrase [Pseudomonas lundensis]|uniref:tyrosine-type recombinase/integrase n=1 Tax=Pseudomonas lundensis TaxID=86185 RepID=UPI000BA2B89E|nr:tyrosine-type recombinase/integrase [Pseudomonas lundensis]OZY33088.1 integrase [Pseudomonas lundensis]OZY46375.1 integrase [Pseudomonas lundensis]